MALENLVMDQEGSKRIFVQLFYFFVNRDLNREVS